MAKMKVNLGTPQEPNWIVMDANNSDTVGGKSIDNIMLKKSGNTLPVASEQYRGEVFTKLGAQGESDGLYVCVKNSEGQYVWLITSSSDSDTVGGKSANDFLPRESGDTLPVASEEYRGLLFTKMSTAGEGDKVYACVKNSNNTYEWVDINSKDSETVGGIKPVDIMLKKSGAELPLASVEYRGEVFTKLGDASVLDEVYICIKNIEDAYEWKQITLV